MNQAPPRLARWLFSISARPSDRTAMLDDLAEEFAGFLRKQGIAADDLLVGDANSVRSRSLIVDRAGKEYTAKKLAEWLNLPRDQIVAASDPEVSAFADATGDIVVLLGSDARLSTAAVPSAD